MTVTGNRYIDAIINEEENIIRRVNRIGRWTNATANAEVAVGNIALNVGLELVIVSNNANNPIVRRLVVLHHGIEIYTVDFKEEY